ncbi:hypothetical protein [Streptomyces sp. NBC_01429]|uniref:hypothetical protein n=1 Tax=Streptomyces sp. NBC_01429 TaxID=2903862 RepID=UPI002E2AA846|nr:hypothetical protein [Streptomyces sp. NBC_01429]
MSRVRLLRLGLLVEGRSDLLFLERLIVRQLEETLHARALKATEVLTPCETAPVYSTAEPKALLQAATALAERCDVLFVHRDHKEIPDAYGLLEALSALPKQAAAPVLLGPRVMTESWVLADRDALVRVQPAADLSAHPHLQPEDVEQGNPAPGHPAHPKRVLANVLKKARRSDPGDYFARLADEVDLSVLGKLSSYQRWLADTDEALKRKKYL